MYGSIAVLWILMTSGILFFYRKLLKGTELTVNLPRAKTKQNKGYFHIACKESGRCTQATFTGHQTDRLKNLSGIFVYTEPFDINFFLSVHTELTNQVAV